MLALTANCVLGNSIMAVEKVLENCNLFANFPKRFSANISTIQ